MGKEIPMESNYLLGKSLLRPDEVAAFMRVCVKTVYRWCEEGKLEGVKIGRTLRFYQKSVMDLRDERGTEENAITEEVYKSDTNPIPHLTHTKQAQSKHNGPPQLPST